MDTLIHYRHRNICLTETSMVPGCPRTSTLLSKSLRYTYHPKICNLKKSLWSVAQKGSSWAHLRLCMVGSYASFSVCPWLDQNSDWTKITRPKFISREKFGIRSPNMHRTFRTYGLSRQILARSKWRVNGRCAHFDVKLHFFELTAPPRTNYTGLATPKKRPIKEI